MSLDTIRVFAIAKLGWIKQQQAKLREQERETPREYVDRESHYVWAKRYLLTVSESDEPPSIELKHSRVLLRVRPGTDEHKRQALVEEWYRGQIKRAVLPLLAKWQPPMGVRVDRFFVQRMKTKWGSCNHKARTIRLNTELTKKPRECLEYIVVHELAHLLEPTHSARFVALMERFMPKWQFYRDQLNRLPVIESPAVGSASPTPRIVLLGYAGLLLWWNLCCPVLEGLWGASPGKALCRLRVVGTGGGVPGVPSSLVRAAIRTLSILLGPILFMVGPLLFGLDGWLLWLVPCFLCLSPALLFSTARRRNGYAALHDLLTRTRVVRKSPSQRQARPTLPMPEGPVPETEATPMIGPYSVLQSLGRSGTEELLLGYDPRLLRKVWLRRLPDGAPPVAERARDLSRAGRIHWLAGKRSQGECWDAYEYAHGKPLSELLGERQPWRAVRYWLFDLAEELQAGSRDQSLPTVLGLDRVWITADGRAKLLDFPAPGMGEQSTIHQLPLLDGGDSLSARVFLSQVASAALEGPVVDADTVSSRPPAVPLPLHARAFLAELPTSPGLDRAIEQLRSLLHRAASVSRLRRLGIVAGCLAVPFALIVCCAWGFWRSSPGREDIRPLSRCLRRLAELEQIPGGDTRPLKVYIAKRFANTITEPSARLSGHAQALIAGDEWKSAEQILAWRRAERIRVSRPFPSEQEFAEAAAIVEAMLDGQRPANTFWSLPKTAMRFLLSVHRTALPVAAIYLAMFAALPSLVWALLFRGGIIFRYLGVAIVTDDGSVPSGLRLFWRELVTWSPLLPWAILPFGGWVLPLAATVFASLAVWSVVTPNRSLQDIIAGTWLVPS